MYRKNGMKWMKHMDFILLDAVCLVLSFFVAFFISRGRNDFLDIALYRELLFMLCIGEIATIALSETFRNVLKRNDHEERMATLLHGGELILMTLGWLFLAKRTTQYSRIAITLTFLIYGVTSYLTREYRKHQLLSGTLKGSAHRKKLLFVTTKKNAQANIEMMLEHNYAKYDFVGVCVLDEPNPQGEIGYVPVIGNKDNILEYVLHNQIDEIYFDAPLDKKRNEEILRGLVEEGATIHVVLKHLDALEGTDEFIEKIGNEYVITSAMATLTTAQILAKRILDIIGGLVGCILTGLIALYIGPKIRKADPGPIIYASNRVGMNGKIFRMYKFRSMVMNADELKKDLMDQNRVDGGLMFKIEHDPRIIGGENGIGEKIRRTSLDEFPQFFNVLKGDMSLVGTRPPTPDEWAKYEIHHKARLSAKPGVTGLWQVSGRSEITDFEEVVKLDKTYITNWSLWGDIKIILKTIKVILKKEGSY